MADGRNRVLEVVRDEIQPDFYASIDTDIFLHETALALALEQMPNWAAVGIRSYMSPSPDRSFPSYGMLKGESLWNRVDAETGTFQVDCIMASKVLSPAAMAIPYRVASSGEDPGWSLACKEAGLRLGWCADAKARHAMSPEMLDAPDIRVGM
jgi:hypothetical protein